MGGPLEVGAKEPVYSAHEFHSEFGGQEAFKALLDCCFLQEIEKIVHVKPEVERLVRQ